VSGRGFASLALKELSCLKDDITVSGIKTGFKFYRFGEFEKLIKERKKFCVI